MSGGTLLSVSHLRAGYGESQVLFDVSLDIGHSEVVALLGRNGMGKTTTISTIMGIISPMAGDIRLEGVAIGGLPSFAVARRGIGLVPEGRQVFPNLTVRENLIAMAKRAVDGSGWTLEGVLELFPALSERLGSWGGLLSGGEQQMLAIGRALLTNPRLLILDEATEGLAPLVRGQIWQVLRRVKAAGLSILIVDKNVEELSRLATRHYILEKGRVVWSGSNDELTANAVLKQRHLGL